ncbi:GtrA family protein [Microbacteriaceae bacterium]|nr:GtrA family protein [Candidatus Saccharibacteria bacterium]
MKLRSLRNNHKLGRFALVGLVATFIDFSIFFTLSLSGNHAIVSNILASSVAFVFSFTANKKYTFKATDTNIIREIILYVVLTLIGLWGFQSVIIHVALDPLTNMLGGHKTLGLIASKFLATGVSLVWNYFMYSRVVFKHTD